MGNTPLSGFALDKPGPETHFIVGRSLEEWEQLTSRFQKVADSPEVDMNFFLDLFVDSAEWMDVRDAKDIYEVFETDGKDTVNMLEIIALGILSSQSMIAERRDFFFDFFDFDNSGDLSEEEFRILLQSVVHGVQKACCKPLTSLLECIKAARILFRYADQITDGKLSKVEFSFWIRSTPQVRKCLSTYDRHGRFAPAEDLSTTLSSTAGSRLRETLASDTKVSSPRSTRSGRRSRSPRAKSSRTFVSPSSSNVVETVQYFGRGSLSSVTKGWEKIPANKYTHMTGIGGGGGSSGTFGSRKGVKFTRAEIMSLWNTFVAMDQDADGSVNFTEFLQAVGKKHVAEVKGMFSRIDDDGSGQVTFEELLTAVYKDATSKDIEQMISFVETEVTQQIKKQNRLNRDQLEHIRDIFNLYDLDGSGEISATELEEGMKRSSVFSKNDIVSTFKLADINGDDSVSFQEFVAFFQKGFTSSNRSESIMRAASKGKHSSTEKQNPSDVEAKGEELP